MNTSRLYRHAVTGIEGVYSDSFAANFPNVLIPVEEEAKPAKAEEHPAPVEKTTNKKDSSKEGN